MLVCLCCGASHAETFPRGRAIDAQRGDQLGGGIWRLETIGIQSRVSRVAVPEPKSRCPARIKAIIDA